MQIAWPIGNCNVLLDDGNIFLIQLRELKCGTLGVSNLACLVCYDRISNAFHLFIALGNKSHLDIEQQKNASFLLHLLQSKWQ